MNKNQIRYNFEWTKKCRIIKTCGVYLLFTHNKFKKQGMQMMFLSLLFCFKLVLIQLYFRFCIALDNHSMDSSNPSPFIALALKIWNVRFFKASSPNALWTSVTDMAPSMSCLLANTTNIAPFNSSSWKIKIKWKNCQNDRTSTLHRLKINKVPRFFPDICL